jgi:DNA-directed RNA polymerase
MTLNLAADNGVTHFAMVHDSFGCHASDVPMLSACIREAFVALYVDNDPMENFLLEAQELTEDPLPSLPPKGSLDVTAVRNSEFFFS